MDILAGIPVEVFPLHQPAAQGGKPRTVVIARRGADILVKDEIVKVIDNEAPVELVDEGDAYMALPDIALKGADT